MADANAAAEPWRLHPAGPHECSNPAARYEHHDKMRLRHAARIATEVLPPGIGRLVARELLTWEEFGLRLGAHTDMAAVAAEVLELAAHRAQAAQQRAADANG